MWDSQHFEVSVTVQYALQPSDVILNNVVGPIYTLTGKSNALIMGIQMVLGPGTAGEYFWTPAPSVNTDISLSLVQTVSFPSVATLKTELSTLVTLGDSSDLGNSLYINIRNINTPPDFISYISVSVMEYDLGNVKTFLAQNISGTPILTSSNSFSGFYYPPQPFATTGPQVSGMAVQFVQNEGKLSNPCTVSSNSIPFLQESLQPYPSAKSIGPIPTFDANSTIDVSTPLNLVGVHVPIHIWGMYLLDTYYHKKKI